MVGVSFHAARFSLTRRTHCRRPDDVNRRIPSSSVFKLLTRINVTFSHRWTVAVEESRFQKGARCVLSDELLKCDCRSPNDRVSLRFLTPISHDRPLLLSPLLAVSICHHPECYLMVLLELSMWSPRRRIY